MTKTSEQIRKDLNLSQTKFTELINMSLRTYQGRLDYSQPDWKLDEVINIAKLNKGKLLIELKDASYEVQIKEIK